ncbi:MAG: TatD family hydrolase [Bacteroidaceae bacterium]|nr:TatD family hydrolase [Bacteroidaceae bacterium]
MNKFVDTHTHIFCEEFSEDRAAVVARAVEAGVTRLLLPAIDYRSMPAVNELCAAYPGVCYPMIGLHPTEINDDYKEQLSAIETALQGPGRYVAIGETGLDFYWSEERRSEQFEVFDAHLQWARSTGLPLAIHSRSAFDELVDVMDAHRAAGLTGVFHCFSGSACEAEKLLSHEGFYLGIGGVLTFKNSGLAAALASVPLERIVLETDSPYLAPVPHRGKRNESSYIPFIAARLAQIYGCTTDDVARITTRNAETLFPLIK